MSADQTLPRVQQILAAVLGVDPARAVSEASLTDDLDAESIDFVDILFRIEQEFGLRIDRDALIAQDTFRDPNYFEDSKLTEAGVQALRERYTFTSVDGLKPGQTAREVIAHLLTVRTLTDLIEHVRNSRAAG
jgi:acyl carrier protein